MNVIFQKEQKIKNRNTFWKRIYSNVPNAVVWISLPILQWRHKKEIFSTKSSHDIDRSCLGLQALSYITIITIRQLNLFTLFFRYSLTPLPLKYKLRIGNSLMGVTEFITFGGFFSTSVLLVCSLQMMRK